MEKLNDSVNLQEEFEKFKEEYKGDLKRFIWYKDDVEFVLDEKASTFYFSPKEKKIWIPLSWFVEYLAVLKGNWNGLEQYKLHWKFWLAHEFSHFRDMLKEQDVTKESSMYKVLKRLSGRKIKISEDKYIPIGEMVHTIYNTIDDIVVNYEVMNFMSFWITPDMIKTLYQTKLFADYEEQPDWSKELNVDKPVDYSTIPDYTAISYYFLRKKMVPDQKIILSDNLKGILFNAEGKNIPWSTSLARLKKLFDDEVNQAKNSDDADTQRRYEQLKSAIVSQRSRLEHMDRGKIRKLLEAALKKCLGRYNPAKISAPTVSLETIIDLFTVNKWGDDSHILCILPDLRYQIYEAIFEPIIETLILIYDLHNDIKDWGWGGWGWWEWGEEWWEWGEEWWEWGEEWWEWGEEWWDDIQSWSGSYNRSLEDALKYIKEAAEYNQNKKDEAQRKKESQKIWKSIIEVLTSKGMSLEDLELKEKVQRNFSEYLEQITKILYEELDAVEIESDTIDAISKKWTLSYDEFLKEYENSPIKIKVVNKNEMV